MSEVPVQALEKAISTRFKEGDITAEGLPARIEESEFVHRDIRLPKKCPESRCSAPIRDSDIDRSAERIHTLCEGGLRGTHEISQDLSKWTYYPIDWENVLKVVSEALGRTLRSVTQDSLPRFVEGYTDDGIRIVVLGGVRDIERVTMEVFAESLKTDTRTLLLVLDETIEPYLEVQSLFATGSLVYTAPFSMLEDSAEYISKPIETMSSIQELEDRILEEHLDSETHHVVKKVNSNPRYILTELNHMRLLRKNKELPRSSGTRLEEVGHAALSTIASTYPDAGGESDRGKNLPDILFKLPQISDPDGKYDPVLGIVDAKSGDDANFGSEPIDGKHDDYLSRARRQTDATQIAHVFIVNEIDGQQELDFYDRIKKEYEKSDNDECMVVFYADALSLLLDALLTVTTRNEIQLVGGDFGQVLYPLFVSEAFNETDVSSVTRDVAQNQPEYDQEYASRDDLLVITTDVVKQRILQYVEASGEVESDLEDYFKDQSILSEGY